MSDAKRAYEEKFQSTRPRGRTRRSAGSNNTEDFRFNPRVLAGGRDKL